MPYNLLLLPLLAGYCFIHLFRFTRFRALQLDGYRLLMSSAVVGLVLQAIAWLCWRGFRDFDWYRSLWRTVGLEIEYLDVALVGVLLALLTAPLLNKLLSLGDKWNDAELSYRAVKNHGNNALRLIHTAQAEERQVMITLKSRKVYIGAVISAPNLAPTDSFVSLIPFLSGYRDATTLELKLTTNYMGREADLSNFEVVVPIAEISTLAYFDHTLYEKFDVESSS